MSTTQITLIHQHGHEGIVNYRPLLPDSATTKFIVTYHERSKQCDLLVTTTGISILAFLVYGLRLLRRNTRAHFEVFIIK